jgi:6-phosphogluconolactonase
MSTSPDLMIMPDAAAIHQAAAERILTLARLRADMSQRFVLALAGGSTPRGLYQRLAAEPFASQMPWQHVHLIWGDERYVPADHADSNYRMVREALLDYVPIPPANIHPVPTDQPTAEAAASAYDREVRALLPTPESQIDLALLGMGGDGHTASLFPHNLALSVPTGELVTLVQDAPKPPPQRISLTLAALNRAAHVLFLVTGADKATALHAVLRGPSQGAALPAQQVQPPQGTVAWLVDLAAADLLEA